MPEYISQLKQMQPAKEFLVAIDSDGCVFDAMGIKQSECFCPMMIAYFGLQPVAKAARECKLFADLFSKTRGANRHKTIVRILTELLPGHPDVCKSNFHVPQFPHYFKWVNGPDSLLSNDGLKSAVELSNDPEARAELEIALKWSLRVDEMVKEIIENVPAFSFVRQSLEKIYSVADIIVCSSTPIEALDREWSEHDLAKYTTVIAGQEMGKKQEHLAVMCEKYDADKILMIGDAPGDQKAAAQNGVLFYPINPGNEDKSWERFYQEALGKFIGGEYAGNYQGTVIDEFSQCLPENPVWQKKKMQMSANSDS